MVTRTHLLPSISSDELVQNGMTFFPVKSMFPKNVLTIAGALSHQIGYPISNKVPPISSGESMPYGIIYSKEPSDDASKFLDIVKNVVNES